MTQTKTISIIALVFLALTGLGIAASNQYINVDGNINATGNITADEFLFGDGRYITGISTGMNYSEPLDTNWLPDSPNVRNIGSSTDYLQGVYTANFWSSSGVTRLNDIDTRMTFSTDEIYFQAGGIEFLRLKNDGSLDDFRVNRNNADVDTIIESQTEEYAFFVEGSTGNVGIGTDSPNYKIDVWDSTINAIVSMYRNGGAIATNNVLGRIVWGGSAGAGTTDAAYIQVRAATGGWNTSQTPTNIGFFTTNEGATTATEKMRIDDNGEVGIGTTSPSADLHVVGTQKFTNNGNTCEIIVDSDGTCDSGTALGVDNSISLCLVCI